MASTPAKEGSVNARVSPLGLLIGYLNFDFDIKMDEQWTLGPTISYWSLNITDYNFNSNQIKFEAYSLGARANWYKNGVFKDSVYISPMIQYVSAKASGTSRTSGSDISASASLPVVSALVGYHWFGQTVNLSAGVGLGLGLGSSKVRVSDGTTTSETEISRGIGLALDLMLGMVF